MEQLQLQQQLIDAIESASDGFAFFDNDDKLVHCNQRFTHLFAGYENNVQLIGQDYCTLIAQSLEKGLWYLDTELTEDQFFEARLKSFKNTHLPAVVKRADGGWIQINERATDDGGTIAIYNDLTIVKQSEAELAATIAELESTRDSALQATKSKSQFLANMSHELHTPLNAIIGYSELLHEEACELELKDFVPDLAKIRDAGKHLLRLINGVLDISKIEAGKMQLTREDFSVAGLVNEVKAVIEPVLDKNQNTLKVEINDNTGNMSSDPTKLRQSLFNLLSNATKFTRQGEIKVSVNRYRIANDDWLEFVVTDTGIGMMESQLASVFEAFAQADSSISTENGRAGLGLAISREFCKMLGGEISVESVYGQGSTFSMKIPAVCPGGETRKEITKDVVRQAGGSDHSVLVIDDDPQTLNSLSEQLGKHGYRVFTADSGRSGLEMARVHKPDVITLDIVMADLDGWSVLSALKSDDSLCHIPVVLITIMADREMGYALGAVDFITKPFDENTVVDAIQRAHRKNSTTDILVVDDSHSARSLLKRTLGREGYRILEADNGARALELLQVTTPAVILLDVIMPTTNGFEFLETIRGDKRMSGIPVIIVSAKEFDSEEMRSLNTSTLEVFQKGAYERDELIKAVNRIIDDKIKPVEIEKPGSG